jgi:hypothetical protein
MRAGFIHQNSPVIVLQGLHQGANTDIFNG